MTQHSEVQVKRAMILAAGRGNRLRPLTDHVPKPLVKVGGESLLSHHLRKLVAAGIQEVVINHAWLGEQIEAHIGEGSEYGVKVHYSSETEGALETAGGILKALPMVSPDERPFLVVNGDVFTEFDFTSLVQRSLDASLWGHLVLVPNPSFKTQGDFGLHASRSLNDSYVNDPYVNLEPQFTFSGISLLSPKLFAGLPQGPRPLGGVLMSAISQKKLSGELYSGYWNDVGTLDRLASANAYADSKK